VHRQPEEGAGGGVDHVHQHVVALAGAVLLVAGEARGGEEAGCDEVVVTEGAQLVAGELGAGEVGEGRVSVEGADDPVAVAPGVRAGVVASVSLIQLLSGQARAEV
jgi:hypothetical protein